MGFFRERLTAAPEQIATIAAEAAAKAVQAALNNHQATSMQALTEAVQGLFVKQLESFGKNTEAMGSFLAGIADLSVKRAAVALGSRGGRKRAENERARQSARQALSSGFPGCAMCVDPMTKDSLAITRHINEQHEQRRRQAQADRDTSSRAEHAEYIRNQTTVPGGQIH